MFLEGRLKNKTKVGSVFRWVRSGVAIHDQEVVVWKEQQPSQLPITHHPQLLRIVYSEDYLLSFPKDV